MRLTNWSWTVGTGQYVPAALSIALLVLITSLGFKHYVGVQTQSRDRFMWNGIGAVAFAFSLFVSILFLFKIGDWYSRGTFFFQFLGAGATILIVRATVHAHIRQGIQSGIVEARRAVLIGDVNDNADVLDNLRQAGIRSVGMLPFPSIHGNTIPGVGAFSHTIRKLVERCRSYQPDDIIFLAAPTDLHRIPSIADALSELPVTIHIIPMGANEGLVQDRQLRRYRHAPSVAPAAVRGRSRRQASFRYLRRRPRTLGAVPLLLMVSLAIRLDSRGPVFFRQTRHGYNNEAIRVFKFRSMRTTEGGNQFKQAVKNDPPRHPRRAYPAAHEYRRTSSAPECYAR